MKKKKKKKIMRCSRFEPATHGFKVQQDVHYAMEASAYYSEK